MDPTQLRIDYFKECLDHAQRYLVLTMGTAVAVWLLRTPAATTDAIALPGMFVQADPATARNLLLAFNFVCASLAGYTVEASHRLAQHLNRQPDVAEIVYEYPSVAASPWPAVRLAVPLVSAVLIGWAQVSWALRHTWNLGIGLGVILPLVPHLVLFAYLWRHPGGSVNPLRQA